MSNNRREQEPAVGFGYLNEGKSGEKYIRIYVKEALAVDDAVAMFKTKVKKNDKSPDYVLRRSGTQAGPKSAPAPQSRPSGGARSKPAPVTSSTSSKEDNNEPF